MVTNKATDPLPDDISSSNSAKKCFASWKDCGGVLESRKRMKEKVKPILQQGGKVDQAWWKQAGSKVDQGGTSDNCRLCSAEANAICVFGNGELRF